MSEQWPGGYLTKTPVTPTPTAAPGVWNLSQQAAYQQAGTWPIPGSNYIEDFFSTYLYTGNGTSQTITNNINLLSTGSVATTGTFLSSSLYGIAAYSDGSYAVVSANGVVKISTSDEVSWQITDSAKTFKNCIFDSSGNLYVAAHSGTTAYIGKYNSSGTVQWFKSCSSSTPDDVFGMAITSDGNLFLGWGDTSGTAVSMKMSSADGSISWQKLLTATSLKCQDVATDSSGNCYQLGYAGSTRYPFIVKYDSNGNTTWQKQLATTDGTGGLYAYGIGVDSSANVFVACYAATGGTNKSWVVKLDSTGALSAQVGSTATNNATGLAVDSAGNVYYTTGNSVFKYNNSLTFQWMRNIYTSPSRNGVKVSGSTVYVSTGGQLALKLLTDGTTYEGYSAQNSGRYYTSPASTSRTSTSITASTSTITFGSGAYTVANSSTANNVTYTTVPQTFPLLRPGNGLTWIKSRSGTYSTGYQVLNDTVRGAQKDLFTNTTGAQSTNTTGLTAFFSNGFSVGSTTDVNGSTTSMVSWTFREQPKFFDIVTYTGDGVAGKTIAHNLGSVPGAMIVKRTDGVTNWRVYHRSLGATQYLDLDETVAAGTATTVWNDTAPTSTVFSVGTNSGVNASGGTYVAYLFAHDAGGFGLTGTDNVISCGTYTGNGSDDGPTVTLGYEPQWLLIKRSSSSDNWVLVDTMRGFSNNGTDDDLYLNPNLSSAETAFRVGEPTATGFKLRSLGSNVNASGSTYIYIAIRRGPMKVPTDATKVFTPALTTNDSSPITSGFPVDSFIFGKRDVSFLGYTEDRLRGSGNTLRTNTTGAESASGVTGTFASNTSITPNLYGATTSMIAWMFQRAPSFFDEVCYTGTGIDGQNIKHNLGVAPELMIVKKRSAASTSGWRVYSSTLGNGNELILNDTAASSATSVWFATTPTSTQFTVGLQGDVGASGSTYVAYLFATCPGVSKVGSYTGNGSTQTINCGFAGGARFVLIKRTDSTGDWYVYDTARGMTTLTDPYLLLNSTAAETATLGSVTTVTTGFAVNASILSAINTNAASYIFLAIA